ncbi:DUF1566 domain-containing protein [Motilimonas sp. KMU-193]|uniref:Lcl domain-containing protein n=1 Tax=Motilimonas sp. KMU-193 TaxID=3388668 RepID=UPI00396B279E
MCWRKLAVLTSAILLGACGGSGTDISGGNEGTTPSSEPTQSPSVEPSISPSDAPSNKVVLTIPAEILELDRKNNTIPFPYTLDLVPSFDAKYSMEITGTAIMGEDYDIEPKDTLTFTSGNKTAILSLTTYQSSTPRGGRTLKIRFSNDEGQEATQTFIISGDVRLNDTGMETFSDETDYNLSLEPTSHPGQDASRGFDVVNIDDDKADAPYYKDGSERSSGTAQYLGQAGFRYTKLDFAGNELNANAADWRCVKDEITGMVWERKAPFNAIFTALDPAAEPPGPGEPDKRKIFYFSTTPSNFNAVNFKYPWLDTNTMTNGGKAGWFSGFDSGALPNNAPYQPANSICAYQLRPRDNAIYCSTEDYVREASDLGVCGFTDWQLPTVEQFRSVFNYQNISNGEKDILDKFFFDCASDDCLIENGATNLYWTATSSAEQPGSAMCFNLTSGQLQLCSKLESNKVMIVRRDDKSLVNNNPTPSNEPTP